LIKTGQVSECRFKAPESFVSAPDGTKEFGEITQEVASLIKRQPGKIRLQFW